jgi:HlyD family secretion protein
MKLKLRKKQISLVVISLLAVVVTAGLTVWGRTEKAQDFMTAKVERGSIRNTVSATGTLQVVTTVQVGSQVSGTIAALYADFNSAVRKHQVIAQLDPSILQAQVASSRANLDQARADLIDARREYWPPKLRRKTNAPGYRAPLPTLPRSGRFAGRGCERIGHRGT